jgi:hypothetical protein
MLDHLLSRKAAAQSLQDRGIKIESSTLAKYATIGGGPAMRKFGRRVLYEPAALAEWIDEKLTGPRRSTSDVEGSK